MGVPPSPGLAANKDTPERWNQGENWDDGRLYSESWKSRKLAFLASKDHCNYMGSKKLIPIPHLSNRPCENIMVSDSGRTHCRPKIFSLFMILILALCGQSKKKMAQFHFSGYKTEKKQYIFNIGALKHWF